MEYYAEVLNGEILSIQTFADAPVDFPEESKDRIFNAELKAGDIHFKASDDFPPNNSVIQGTHFSMFVSFSDLDFRKKVFENLAKEGKVAFPLNEHFGMLTDKFGLQWMIVSE